MEPSRKTEFVEVKYLRELQTGSHRPRSLWLGMLLRDIFRFKEWVLSASKFLLVITDTSFEKYLKGKLLIFPPKGIRGKQKIRLRTLTDSKKQPVSEGLPKTAMKELLEFRVDEMNILWVTHEKNRMKDLIVRLIEIL